MVDALILFPLRLMRLRFGDSPLLIGIDDEFTREILRLCDNDGDLKERTFGLLIEASATAASILEHDGGNAAAGTFTVSAQLVECATDVAEAIQASTDDQRLRAALAEAVPFAQTLRGTRLSDIAAVLRACERGPSESAQPPMNVAVEEG